MSWLVVAIAALGVVAWVQAVRNYRAAQELLRIVDVLSADIDARQLAERLKREECASDWRHMSTRGGLS